MEQYRKPRKEFTHLSHLICDKEGKNIKWRNNSLFNRWCRENWTTTYKRMKLEHSLTLHKSKPKFDQSSKYKSVSVNFLEENIGRILFNINCSNLFLDLCSRAGVPKLQDLMTDDLRWSWSNNNRNKVQNKCNALESSPKHLVPPSLWKNCLPENQSLVPKSVETAVLSNGMKRKKYTNGT